MKTCWILVGLFLAVSAQSARARDWTRLQGEDFVILSSLPERDTRNWAVEFDQFHHGLGQVFQLHEEVLQPVTVVLFSSGRDLKAYLPLEKGKPAQMAGIFLHSPIGSFIEVSDNYEDKDTRHYIFHEAVHWLTMNPDAPLPPWMAEGLAEVFSTFSVTAADEYRYGAPVPGHVDLLSQRTEKRHASEVALPGWPMPLKDLLAVRQDSLLFNEGNRTSIFYAESWAFVHYLLFANGLAERPKYNQLLRLLRPGTDPDAVFRQVFGTDCAGMDRVMEYYMNRGEYALVTTPFNRAAVNQTFQVRHATRAEIELAECSLLVAVDRGAEAEPRLAAIERSDPSNPLVWNAAGYAAYKRKDPAATELAYQRAAALGSKDYFVYSYLGDAALGLTPGSPPSVAPGDDRGALALYRQEVELNPLDQHAYDNSAGIVLRLDGDITAADRRLVTAGVRLFPADDVLRVALDLADLRIGRVDSALASLRGVAADSSPDNRVAASAARQILEQRWRVDAFARLNARAQKQDFAGVIAVADEVLASPSLTDQDRASVTTMRRQAAFYTKVNQAVALANSNQADQALTLLRQALGEAPDQAMHDRVSAMIDQVQGR